MTIDDSGNRGATPSQDSAPTKVKATVNGDRRELAAGETLLSLLGSLGIKPDRVAIEYDRKILKPAAWGSTEIRDGAEIEIVHFVGGG